MADTLPPPSHRLRADWLIACAGLLCLPSWAQVCGGNPGPMSLSIAGERFGMLVEQCPGLAGPLKPHRAAQLDLYSQPATMPPTGSVAPAGASAGGPAVAPAPAAAGAAANAPSTASPPRRPLAPPTRDAMRVIALSPALAATALEFRIDPLLLHAVAHVESRHNPQAVSPAGARGVMQVMPATARRFGVGNPEQTLLDAKVNLRASAAYLQQLRERYGDDLRLTLAAYNAGEGAVSTYGGVPPFAETQAYVRSVMAVYRRLGDAFTVLPSGQLVERGGRS